MTLVARLCILFDVDGTLCDTNKVDDWCYRHAAASALSVSPDEVDWSPAPHRTDSGIARYLWEKFAGRSPTSEERMLLRNDFVDRLRAELQRNPGGFRCIPGASRLLDALRNAPVAFGIATGGWRPSAELKLNAAGLDTTPLRATADDDETRVGIFSLAHRLVAGSSDPTRTLLVGDSVPDVATAHHMRWHFLGVGSGPAADRLRHAGAQRVFPNYTEIDVSDIERLWEETAMRPG